MRESDLMKEIMIALSAAGCMVFRNNTGTAYQGKVIHQSGNQVTLADARVIVFGLCVGSADIIGIAPDGRFLAVEVKTAKGKTTPEQERFIFNVQLAGGIAGVARSVDDALRLVQS